MQEKLPSAIAPLGRLVIYIGRLKCLATGLDTSLSFFPTSQRGSRNRSSSCLPVLPLYIFFFNKCKLYVVNNIGGGAREVISTRNGLFGSRYFLNIMNERTSFASCATAYESFGSVASL